MHHQPVSTAERVEDVRHVEGNRSPFSRFKRLGLLEAVSEAPSDHVATNQLLIAAHANRRRIRHRIWIVVRKDIHHLDHPVGVGARGRYFQRRAQRTGESEILVKRRRLIHQHVGAAGDEALVLQRVGAGIAGLEFQGVRNRLARVADVLVRRVAPVGRLETQAAGGVQIKGFRNRFPRRPGIEVSPAVGTRLVHRGLGRRGVGISLQITPEERKLELLPKILGGLRVERHHSEMISSAAPPLPVRPRSHDQQVRRPRIQFLHPRVRLQRPKQILRIIPSTHRHHRAVHVLEMRPDVPRLPPGVVGGMLKKLVPDGCGTLEILAVRVGQRAHAQEELVTVLGAVEKVLHLLVQRIPQLLIHPVEEAKVLSEEEGAVVMDVVAHEPVRNRRLR